MELQFQGSVLPTLNWAAWEPQKQEQTLEVKLPDSSPDIGHVTGTWGQCILRSKEWRGSGMVITGGVMAWALYTPEGDAGPEKIECWIPFQMKWDFQETDREGSMRAFCQLRSIDARMISARKLMFRANVTVLGEATEPVDCQVYKPEATDENVQFLQRTYPIMLPKEAGEKAFSVEEKIAVPGECPAAESICAYELIPVIHEQKVMGERAVFRGTGNLHVQYFGQNGKFCACQIPVPFSQYTDLQEAYSQDAELSIVPAVTNLEVELDEDQSLAVKYGIAAQYVISDREMVQTVEDSYCPGKNVENTIQELVSTSILDRRKEVFQEEATASAGAGTIVDVTLLQDYPQISRMGETLHLQLMGQFQVLYYDEEGKLQSVQTRFEDDKTYAADENTDIHVYPTSWGNAAGNMYGTEMRMNSEVAVDLCTLTRQGIPMVTGIEIGEAKEVSSDRPSLVLRRVKGESLWNLAKQWGTTVEEIRQANQLQEEPEAGQILLIPVP